MDTAQIQSKKTAIANTLILVALAFLTVAILMFFAPPSLYMTFFAFIALIIGLVGFDQFKEAHTIPPPLPATFDSDLISTVLRTGTPIHIHFDLTITPEHAPPYAHDLIKSRLQRALNMYGSQSDALPADPYTHIENLLQAVASPLCERLGLQEISVKVINVEVQGAAQPPSRGFRLGR